jgi:putative nucleotidyltransferase with HDIG domain
MNEKYILLADTETGTAEELQQALGQEWLITWVQTGTAAVEELKKREYHGLVVSLHLADLKPAQLLNRVRQKYPKTVRFVVATEKDRGRVVKEALGAHQFLTRPFDADGLRTTIQRAMASDVWIASENLHKLVARVRSLPAIPALHLEIVAALRSPDSTTEEVGALIAKDMAVTAKLLQVINSAYFGLPRTVTSPADAVSLLGFETVKSMVMAVKLLNHYDRLKLGSFSMDTLWQHSTAVADAARQLTLLQTEDRNLADQAYTAGLLHDVGKAVLAGNFSEQYAGAQSLADKRQLPLSDVEHEIFGANHAEIGAYLLSLWGLPLNILEAAALHHQPQGSPNKVFTPLTAVHVANALQHAMNPGQDDQVRQEIDMEYLAELGMVECLPAWCAEILGSEVAEGYLASKKPETAGGCPQSTLASTPPPSSTLILPGEVSAAEQQAVNSTPQASDFESLSEVSQNQNSAQDGMAQLTNSGEEEQGSLSTETYENVQANSYETVEGPSAIQPDMGLPVLTQPSRRNRWLVAAALPAVLLLAFFVFGRFGRQAQAPLTVNAHPAESVSTEAPQESPNPASVAERPTAVTGGSNSDIQNHNGTSAAVGSGPAPSPDPIVQAPSAPQTDVQSQPLTVVKQPQFPALKLQGILFSPRRPSAIINGALVHSNDWIEAARVVEIRSTNVTIQFQNERKTLTLE